VGPELGIVQHPLQDGLCTDEIIILEEMNNEAIDGICVTRIRFEDAFAVPQGLVRSLEEETESTEPSEDRNGVRFKFQSLFEKRNRFGPGASILEGSRSTEVPERFHLALIFDGSRMERYKCRGRIFTRQPVECDPSG